MLSYTTSTRVAAVNNLPSSRACSVGHIIKIYTRLEELGVRVVAVGTGNPDAAKRFQYV
jgi:hypothetical protein